MSKITPTQLETSPGPNFSTFKCNLHRETVFTIAYPSFYTESDSLNASYQWRNPLTPYTMNENLKFET